MLWLVNNEDVTQPDMQLFIDVCGNSAEDVIQFLRVHKLGTFTNGLQTPWSISKSDAQKGIEIIKRMTR